MAEAFLRDDLKAQGIACDASELIDWARGLADSAPAENVFRSREGRKTLRFEQGGKSYFLKLHLGIGWGEIIKNLLQARLPVLGAENEFRAVNALTALGVDTMSVAAYARAGSNPAAQHSMIVTEDLVGTISLEDYCADWAQEPPPWRDKLRLLLKLADSSRRMHGAGINHRDYYICHFHLAPETLAEGEPRCHMIDLHRAQMRARTPRRWRVKDLAGLYFSAMDCGLGHRDLLRFLARYTPGGLRQALGPDRRLWQDVQRRAERLYQREHGRPPPAVGE